MTSFANRYYMRKLFALVLSFIALLPASAAWPASREPVRATHGMVATAEPLASQTGVEVLRRGGNAVDAAIAVAFTLSVTYPVAGNLGGGGFMLIHFDKGRSTAIDYRETAPTNATRAMYLDASGTPLTGITSSTSGYRAAGVPGTVAGLALAYRKYASHKLTWAQLIEPARRLAQDGFRVSSTFSKSLEENRAHLSTFPESRRIFLSNGKPLGAGEIFKQPELAATLARLQKYGAREFYQGQTARRIAADMAQSGGLITRRDLQKYSAKERQPVIGTYRGYHIVSMPPPSSGGTVLIEMLNMLEAYGELPKINPQADEEGRVLSSGQRIYLLSEVMQRAFADRAKYFGDPDFVSVPVEKLTSKPYAAQQRNSINMALSTLLKIPATPPGDAANLGHESTETTHFTIVDAEGNAVANTYTLNGAYGSGVMIKGTGILLNNEMDDFAIKPDTPNQFGLIQGEQNTIAPRKRPVSSMTPTFVLHPNGKLWFALGSPGGPTIINTVLQIISNVIDYGMNIQEAVDAPRVHHQWQPNELVYEPEGFSIETLQFLKQLPLKLTDKPRFMGDAQAVMIDPQTGTRLGASDSRRGGVTVGY